MEYLSHKQEIEAASTTLESCRKDFQALLAKEEACLERAHSLFTKERFVPLRFSAADVRGAFAKVGYPGADDGTTEILRKAILFLASRPRRTQLAMKLLHCSGLVGPKQMICCERVIEILGPYYGLWLDFWLRKLTHVFVRGFVLTYLATRLANW